MKKLLYISPALVVLMCACQPQPEREFVPVTPEQKVRSFPLPFDTVYEILLDMLKRQDIDLSEADRDLGTVATRPIPINPESETGKSVLFKTGWEVSINTGKYDIRFKLKKTGENSTRVEIAVRIEKYSRTLFLYYSWKEQPSNGYIERKIFDDLAAALEKR